MPTSIKDLLAKLVVLQEIDSHIYSLEEENKTKPAEIQKLKDAFEEKKNTLADLDNKQKDLLKKKRKDKELELASKEENIKKSQGQLYALKTNKEYHAKLSEIDGLKADSSVLEEAILKFMEEQDALVKEVEAAKQQLKTEENLFNQEKAKIDERVKLIKEEINQLNSKRSQIAPQVDQKYLTVYERILKNKEGLALAAVKNNACQGCYMTVTHQVVNEIKMFDRLIACEACARILYIEEDLNIERI